MSKTIEQEFYEAFDIEPQPNTQVIPAEYPPITDHILLELICVYMTLPEIDVFLEKPSLEELKKDVLSTLANRSEEIIDIDKRYPVYLEVRKIMGV